MIVRYEDGFWINGIGVYFWILEDINQTFLELMPLKDNTELIEQLFFKLSIEISRLIPTQKNKKTKEFKLSKTDGILCLKQYFDFLINDYYNLFNSYKDTLDIMHDIRNRYFHNPHYIRWSSYIGNTENKRMVFHNMKYDPIIISKLNAEERQKIDSGEIKLKWEIKTNDILNIIETTNEIFEKIQEKFFDYFKNNKSALDHPYIKNVLSIKLKKYNETLQKYKNK